MLQEGRGNGRKIVQKIRRSDQVGRHDARRVWKVKQIGVEDTERLARAM